MDRVIRCRSSRAVALTDAELLNFGKYAILPHVGLYAAPCNWLRIRASQSAGGTDAAKALDDLCTVAGADGDFPRWPLSEVP